jgi:nicotinate-nucleotide adenylyltransferase
MNIGIMGGTFDPVHLGHLAIAREACRRLKMSEVIFIPAGHPYFKATELISPAKDRVEMLKLALRDTPQYKISLLEIQRPGPSYLVDTLSKIKEKLKPGDELFFILGWDSLLALPRWHEPERLIESVKIIAAPRPGYPEPDIFALEKDLPGISQCTIVMDQPVIDVSATDIRERVRRGLTIHDLVTPEVEKYIKDAGLYAKCH